MTTPKNPKTKPAPGALKPELEALLAQLRAGLAPGASAAAKQEAATVCRVLQAALGTQPGQPMTMPGMSPPAAPAGPTATAAAPAPAPASVVPAAPPNLLDLVTTWARANLDLSEPPHQQVPHVGTSDLMQMMGALGTVFGGGRP